MPRWQTKTLEQGNPGKLVKRQVAKVSVHKLEITDISCCECYGQDRGLGLCCTVSSLVCTCSFNAILVFAGPVLRTE